MLNTSYVRYVAKLLMVGLFFYLAGVQAVSAQVIPASELDGYAWSSNIGWISLNCKTGGVTGNNICATSNYEVVINANRTITGYAWSSNIGWIKFGGLSSFPIGGGTSAVNASVTGTYPNLSFTGWARACAGTDNPTTTEQKNCSIMTMNDNSGLWDGWIALSGTNHQISTNVSGLVTNSYAWGSDVVGWVNMFTHVSWLKPGATISMASCTIPLNGSNCMAATTWNITNAVAPYEVRNVTTNAVFSTATSGTNQMNQLQLGSNTIRVSDASGQLNSIPVNAGCVAGTVASGTQCVVNPPVITITTNNRVIVRAGDTVTVDWTITPSPLTTGSCTLSGPGLSGATTTGGSQSSGALYSKSVFRIACTGTFGTAEASTAVEIIPSAQEV